MRVFFLERLHEVRTMPINSNLGTLAVKRKSVVLDGLKLFYRDTETPGPLILCLHGRFGRGETWLNFIGRYSERFRIVAPDQRGHGLSDKPRGKYTSEELAQDAANLIEQLNTGPAIAIGHSMGGRVAGYLSALHPQTVSALVVLDQTAKGPATPSTMPLNELPAKDSFTLDWPLPFSSYTQAREYLLGITQSEVRTAYYLDSLVERDDGYHMLFSQQATSAIFEYQQDWFHLLQRISQPVLLVRAKDSVELSTADCKRMQNMLPSARTTEVSRPEHHVYLSDPAEFYSCLDSFLLSL